MRPVRRHSAAPVDTTGPGTARCNRAPYPQPGPCADRRRPRRRPRGLCPGRAGQRLRLRPGRSRAPSPASPGSVLGFADGGDLEAVCWASANVVPVGCGPEAVVAFAGKVRKWRRQCASLFGPADMVLGMWDELATSWGTPRAVRRHQPLMELSVAPSAAGVAVDPRVRRARPDEVDLVVPAAAAMFTEEIGYPPYWGSGAAYRQGVAGLIARGHTFVRVEDGQVVFKADVGSVGLGVAQIQGVWVAPRLARTGARRAGHGGGGRDGDGRASPRWPRSTSTTSTPRRARPTAGSASPRSAASPRCCCSEPTPECRRTGGVSAWGSAWIMAQS